jgi:hypothetical protein
MTSHHVPKEARKEFKIVFQARFSFGRDASDEYQTITYPYTGTLAGAKLKASDLFKRRFETFCRRGDVNVDISYEGKLVASKTFWRGGSWANSYLVRSLDL